MTLEKTETGNIYINNSRFILFLYVVLFSGIGLFVLALYFSAGDYRMLYISWVFFAVALVFLFNFVKNKNVVVIDNENICQRKLIGIRKYIRLNDIERTDIFRHKNTKYTVIYLKNGGIIKIMTLFLQGYKCEDFRDLIDKKIEECGNK